MKKFSTCLTLALLFTLVIIAAAFAADPVVVAVPAPPVSWFQSLLPWLSANQVIVGMLLIGILDFIFAINPEWKSNGALHGIYVLLQNRTGATPSTPPAAR
jgi:membrane-bound ClpP family serine protease